MLIPSLGPLENGISFSGLTPRLAFFDYKLTEWISSLSRGILLLEPLFSCLGVARLFMPYLQIEKSQFLKFTPIRLDHHSFQL